MKVWITAYALTRGIIECTQRGVGDLDGSIVVEWAGGLNGEARFRGHDWRPTKDAAERRMLSMIAAKRKSIAKQLAKLDKLERKVREGMK